MARKKQEIILENVVIESVAAEGKAIARIDGTVLFVQFAVPGDVVDVKVTKKKKNYMEGFILRMVKPSEHRLEPFCKHFGVCGGCKWQPLPYDMQLQAKQQQVYDQLVRIGHLDVPEISPIVASDETTYYRNKLELHSRNIAGSSMMKMQIHSPKKRSTDSVSMSGVSSTRSLTSSTATFRQSRRMPSAFS